VIAAEAPRGSAALLALDGELPSAELIRRLSATHDVLVAADGAARALSALGITVDLVIGDLDGLGADRERIAASGALVIEEPGQEWGDFEKALEWIERDGYASVTVIGIGGGLIDHALNNFSVLARHVGRLRIAIAADGLLGWCVGDELRFSCTVGDRVSLIPLPAATVATEGLAWALSGERLAFGEREGASNRATDASGAVSVSDGVLLVVHVPAV
jgi:thiamine pyrophosphokinase